MMGVASYTDDADNNVPRVPDDPATRAQLIQAIQSGYGDMIRSWRGWSWLTQPVTVQLGTTATALNLDGDTAKVVLMGHVASGFEGDPMLVAPGQTTPFRLMQKSVGEITSRLASDPKTGRPLWVSLLSVPSNVPNLPPRTVVAVWPKPDGVYTITASVRLAQRLYISDLGEALPCPMEHAETVVYLAARKLQVESPKPSGPNLEVLNAECARMLKESKDLDATKRPTTIPQMIAFDKDLRDPFAPRYGTSSRVEVLP
jgi:hypothetical protein